jgi:hypothetical protein
MRPRPAGKKIAVFATFCVVAGGAGFMLAGIGGAAGFLYNATTHTTEKHTSTDHGGGGGGGTTTGPSDCPTGEMRDNSGNCVPATTTTTTACPPGTADDGAGNCVPTTGAGAPDRDTTPTDLEIFKDGPATATFGRTMTFTLQVDSTNRALPPGTTISVEERVAVGTLVSIGGPGWDCQERARITGPGPRGPVPFARIFCTFTVGDAELDQLPNITVTERVIYPGNFQNCAVTGRTVPGDRTANPQTLTDPDLSDDSSCADVFIPRPLSRLVTRASRIPCTGPYGGNGGRGGGGSGGGTGGTGGTGGGGAGGGGGTNNRGFGNGAGFPFGGNPPPNGTFGIDHFLCYLTTAGPGSPPRAVSISDQFFRVPAFRTQTTTPDRLCTPVSVNDGKGFLAFKTGKNGPHLYCYRVTSRAQDKTVHTADQFGYDTLRMLRAERLCVASAKNRRKLTPAPPPPANFANYLCYAVRAVDSPARHFPVINVNDQFWTTRTGVAVLRPAELCTPARTTGAGLTPSPVPNARDQLVCYAVALRSSFPGADVFVTNKLDSQRASKLPSGGGAVAQICLPALLRVGV